MSVFEPASLGVSFLSKYCPYAFFYNHVNQAINEVHKIFIKSTVEFTNIKYGRERNSGTKFQPFNVSAVRAYTQVPLSRN